MSVLLDTHAILWYFAGSAELSPTVKEAIDGRSDLNFSIASLWEIAIKANIGKLELQIPFQDVPDALGSFNIQILPITFDDTQTYLNLPLHHRDPFDRMLAAQAINNSLTLFSRDVAFDSYELERIWD